MDRIYIGSVGVAIAGVTLAHFYTPHENILFHNIFQRLYYLPIIFASMLYGWRGGLAASAFAGFCYIPHIVIAWHQFPGYAINQYAEIAVFFLVGILTGLLSDRQRKQKSDLEIMAGRLSKVNRELQESFDQLQRADRLAAIGHLSAGLAHEIRNPISSIEGAAGIIKRGGIEDQERGEFLNIIEKECRRLNRLLTDLLDFARPRPPQRECIHIGRLLDYTIQLTEHLTEKKRITFRKEMPDPDLAFHCDAEQLRQVLLNLALNAIQAMPEGGEIVLAARRQNAHLLIQVTDQGVGIAEEDLEKIFNPFYTTREQGTGLGLAVAFQIIRRHGGTLQAEKNRDRGMTFSILLPHTMERKE